MEKLGIFAITAMGALLLAGVASAEPAKNTVKTVTFKIINHSKTHKVDLDTDGGVSGECQSAKDAKDIVTCTSDVDGKISIGGHLAVDRSFDKPSGVYGAIFKVTSSPGPDGRNFVIDSITSSPVTASLSTDKWSSNKEEVTITVDDANAAKNASASS